MAHRYPAFAHQNASLKFFSASWRGFDASDPGTGKTRVQIDLFNKRRSEGAALIVAPKSLLESAWKDDFAKFAPHLKCSVAYAENREKAFAEQADVYITNTDAVKWLVKQPASFFSRFSTLIVDEMSSFKHHTSQRSRAINKIKKYFKYRYGMTGTPNTQSITDLWHQVMILDDGKRLGKSFYAFRSATCTPTQVGPTAAMVKWEDKPGAEMAVAGLLKDLVIRHVFEECVDIPANHTYTVNYHLTPKQLKIYDQMEKNAVAALSKTKVVSAVHASSVMTKLLQIASGAVYTGDESYSNVDVGRYELVADLVEQRAHSVVFFNWKHQRDGLVKELTSRGIAFAVIDGDTSNKERVAIVHDYQAGLYRAVVAHPQSAAHGLTLTRGTATIWASPTHNLEHFIQGNKRIYRVGQKLKTETILVRAAGTIEDRVYDALTAKDARQGAMLSLLEGL